MKTVIITCLVLLIGVAGFVFLRDSDQPAEESPMTITTPVVVPEGLEVATFAGGCFWCTEAVFQEQDGIGDVISGYAGGQEENPVYEDVARHITGHRESVQFFYDPDVISYGEILDILWQTIDPTDSGGQFVDRGFAYTTAAFYHDEAQKAQIEASIARISQEERFQGFPIVTQVLPFTTFYPAEAYHQDYYLKSSEQYNRYESNSGRDQYKELVWPENL